MPDDPRSDELPEINTLDELAELAEDRDDLYVRWSKGPQTDEQSGCSLDELTGVELPGLSANPLAVEDWWRDNSHRLWLARRLYDYRHLAGRRGPDVRPWVLEGDVVGRGPDNEPLVRCRRPLAWIARGVIDEATQLIEKQPSAWGSLDRTG